MLQENSDVISDLQQAVTSVLQTSLHAPVSWLLLLTNLHNFSDTALLVIFDTKIW